MRGHRPAAVEFCGRLGARVPESTPDGDWALPAVGGGGLGPPAHPPNPGQAEGTVEPNVAAASPGRGRGRAVDGVPVRGTGFGRRLRLSTPDGLPVEVNEFRRAAP